MTKFTQTLALNEQSLSGDCGDDVDDAAAAYDDDDGGGYKCPVPLS